MSNVYHVTMMDGAAYEVTTNDHHAGRDEGAFRRHLADLVAGSPVGAAGSGAVRAFAYRGASENAVRRLVVFGDARTHGR